MARPNKQGADYFPLDVHTDDKLKIIQIKYGLEGFAIVIKMFQRIYSNGYWCQWGEDEGLIFADENKIEHIKLKKIVEECLKRNIFNNGMYEHHSILTSNGIQKRYNEIIRRRKDVELVKGYIVNDELMSTLCKHNDNNNGTSSTVNVDINEQIEREKEKETEKKQKRNKTEKETESKTKRKKQKIYTCTLEDSNIMTNDELNNLLNTHDTVNVKCAEYVTMKLQEYQKLIKEHGETIAQECIVALDNYKGSSGRKYKSDYRAILSWVLDKVKEKQTKNRQINRQNNDQTSGNMFFDYANELGDQL